MALIFKRIQTEGIAELSYLLGDDSAGVAAVFDPTADVEKYVTLVREKQVSITHIFETHIHADLVSGGLELRERVGQAKVFCSHEGEICGPITQHGSIYLSLVFTKITMKQINTTNHRLVLAERTSGPRGDAGGE